MEDKLKPCPFCLSFRLKVADPKLNPAHESWVHCKDCNATSGTQNSVNAAVELWNERQETEALEDENKRLREALEEVVKLDGEAWSVADTVEALRNSAKIAQSALKGE
jgi:Lar family restriction alleviation protein